MSLGVTFIISMIPLGFYFDRYRNLAYGITSSGVGIGIMVLAPITSALIEHYTWRGTCIVFAAMLLHYYAFALIVDPITYTADVERKSSAEEKSRLEANKVMVYDKQNGTLDGNQSLRNTVLKQQLYNKDSHSSYHSLQDLDTKEKQKASKMHCEGKCVLQSNKELSFSDRDVGSRLSNKNKSHLYDDVMLHMSTDFISRSYVSLNAQEPSDTHGINNKINDASKDVSNDDTTTWGAFKNAFMIFTNIKYDLFCLNIILISAAIATIYNHLPAYSIAMGCTETNVSFLISVIGVSNISIRLLTGLITSTKCNSMIFYLGLLSLLSVLFLLAPMYGQYYIGQIFVAIVAGACNASIVLMSPFVIQFVGLESLDVGFGFIMFMAGIGFLLGPPASGMYRMISILVSNSIHTLTYNYISTLISLKNDTISYSSRFLNNMFILGLSSSLCSRINAQ